MTYIFSAEVWQWSGENAWYFVSIPKLYNDELSAISSGIRRSFGSLKVSARIGDTTWTTSLFPDKKSGTFLLPVKKSVRLSESLKAGSLVQVNIRVAE